MKLHPAIKWICSAEDQNYRSTADMNILVPMTFEMNKRHVPMNVDFMCAFRDGMESYSLQVARIFRRCVSLTYWSILTAEFLYAM